MLTRRKKKVADLEFIRCKREKKKNLSSILLSSHTPISKSSKLTKMKENKTFENKNKKKTRKLNGK